MSETVVRIDERFIVKLRRRGQEKELPLYAGVLDAATRSGLKSLTTRVLQLPTPENGHYAVVSARAEFEDGRVFEELGDASPQSVEAHLQPSLLRMAATRAKGRALRDGINCAMALLEEMPPEDGPPLPQGTQAPVGGHQQRVQPPPPEEPRPVACHTPDCGSILTRDELLAATRYAEAYGGGKYCAEHGRPLVRAWKDGQRAAAVAGGDDRLVAV